MNEQTAMKKYLVIIDKIDRFEVTADRIMEGKNFIFFFHDITPVAAFPTGVVVLDLGNVTTL